MQFEELSLRLQDLRHEIASLRQRNAEHAAANDRSSMGQMAHYKRRIRLEQIREEIAAILKQFER
ncbi:MAG: hypothetical protein NVS9B5_35150 [Terriglobales bacterium]